MRKFAPSLLNVAHVSILLLFDSHRYLIKSKTRSCLSSGWVQGGRRRRAAPGGSGPIPTTNPEAPDVPAAATGWCCPWPIHLFLSATSCALVMTGRQFTTDSVAQWALSRYSRQSLHHYTGQGDNQEPNHQSNRPFSAVLCSSLQRQENLAEEQPFQQHCMNKAYMVERLDRSHSLFPVYGNLRAWGNDCLDLMTLTEILWEFQALCLETSGNAITWLIHYHPYGRARR